MLKYNNGVFLPVVGKLFYKSEGNCELLQLAIEGNTNLYQKYQQFILLTCVSRCYWFDLGNAEENACNKGH